MTIPTFEFEATLTTQDRYEREFDVNVTYGFDGTDFNITGWKADRALTGYDFDIIDDQIAARCQQDYADWLADQDDCPAPESYIPAGAL